MITNSYNFIVFLPKNVNPVQEFGEKASFLMKRTPKKAKNSKIEHLF